MKLFYAPGTCSLAIHIVALECNIELTMDRINLKDAHRYTASGQDYIRLNPKNNVPALELDDGVILTEGTAIIQFIADMTPKNSSIPVAGTIKRYYMQEWLSFISTEIHKMFSPWLFHPEYSQSALVVAHEKLHKAFEILENTLVRNNYLMGDKFSVVDAYCFTIVRWSCSMGIDLSEYPNLQRYLKIIAVRPAVSKALAFDAMP